MAFTLSAAGAASAAEYTWTNFQGGNFDSAANWTPAGGPPTFLDTATFTNPPGAAYTVSVPRGNPSVYAMRVTGGNTAFDGAAAFQIGSGLDDALLVRNNGASPGITRFSGLVMVTGGVTVSGTTGDPTKRNELSAMGIFADRLFVTGGIVSGGRIVIDHDAQVGTPGAARTAQPVASLGGNPEVSGVLRIHPDGEFFGSVVATGGVQNAGRIAEGAHVIGDLVNSGEFDGGDPGTGNFSRSSVVGDFLQTAEGVLRLRTSSFPANKSLTLSGGTVDVGGTIIFTPTSPGGAKVGDRFPLIGTEAPINYSANLVSGVVGMSFDPLLVPGDGLYAVTTAVPEPAGAATLVCGAGLFLRRRRANR
jgi:hypothetical protein